MAVRDRTAVAGPRSPVSTDKGESGALWRVVLQLFLHFRPRLALRFDRPRLLPKESWPRSARCIKSLRAPPTSYVCQACFLSLCFFVDVGRLSASRLFVSSSYEKAAVRATSTSDFFIHTL